MRRQRLEVAVVHRRVGVLLRVEDPDHQVRDRHQPVDLEVVGHLGRVVVGQVEQDDAVELLVVARGVEHRVTHRLVPRRDAQPVQQLSGTRAPPHHGGGPRRRRPAHPHRGELQARQRVVRRGLAGAGRAGDGDHRVPGRETQPAGRPLHRGLDLVEQRLVEPAARRGDRGTESGDPGTDLGAPGGEVLGDLRRRLDVLETVRHRCPPVPFLAAANRRSSTRRAACRSWSGASGLSCHCAAGAR